MSVPQNDGEVNRQFIRKPGEAEPTANPLIVGSHGQPLVGKQPEAVGPIKRRIQEEMKRRAELNQAKEDIKKMEMTTEEKTSGDKIASKPEDLVLSIANWVTIYRALFDRHLEDIGPKVAKLSGGGTYKLFYTMNADKLPEGHSSGAYAAVMVQVHLNENGIQRCISRASRLFRTSLEFQQGQKQGYMECFQQILTDMLTFAVTTDIATHYERTKQA